MNTWILGGVDVLELFCSQDFKQVLCCYHVCYSHHHWVICLTQVLRNLPIHTQLERLKEHLIPTTILIYIYFFCTTSGTIYLKLSQGCRVGTEVRFDSGFDSRTRRHKCVEFVGSLLCSQRFFSGYSGFPLSSNTNI